jgi:hypothetical protein
MGTPIRGIRYPGGWLSDPHIVNVRGQPEQAHP